MSDVHVSTVLVGGRSECVSALAAHPCVSSIHVRVVYTFIGDIYPCVIVRIRVLKVIRSDE